MNIPSESPLPVSTGVCPNGRVLWVAAALVAATDFLLWPARWGLSFGGWIGAVLLALFCCRPLGAWRGRVTILAGLLAATAVQSAVEISFSNGVVALALVVGLMGGNGVSDTPARMGAVFGGGMGVGQGSGAVVLGERSAL